MHIKVGERYSNEIALEHYGTYMINDPQEPVYIVLWERTPWRADANGSETMGGHTYKWNTGDYICRGA